MTVTPASLRLRRNTFSLTVLSIYCYILLEWLFFVTKASFTASLHNAEIVRILLLSPLLPLLLSLGLQSILYLLLKIFHPGESIAHGVLAFVPVVVIACLQLLLIDNFTQTFFHFSTVTSGSITRFVYAAMFLLLVVSAFRWMVKLQKSERIARHGLRAAVTCVAVSVLTALGALAGVFDGGILASDIPQKPIRKNSRELPNILMLAADGISADHTSTYGYWKDTTPFQKTFSAQTLFCENAYSNVGRTYGSLLSMLSGKPPAEIKALFPPSILTGKNIVQHLPFILRQLGYTTYQVTMRYYADSEDANMKVAFDVGNDRPISHQVERLILKSSLPFLFTENIFLEQMAQRISDRLFYIFGFSRAANVYSLVTEGKSSPFYGDENRLRDALQVFSHATEPWFLHLHFFDTHCCWELPEKQTKELYDQKILNADRNLQSIIEALESVGLMERTIIVISSDHQLFWDTRGRVPLMFRFPEKKFAGKIHENVQLLDVAPTILDYLGVPKPKWMSGQSLLSPTSRSRPIFGINQMLIGNHVRNPSITQLKTLAPPYYGAGTYTMVLCHQWWEYNLQTGRVHVGESPGHTAPCSMDKMPSKGEAVRMMRKQMRAYDFGFQL